MPDVKATRDALAAGVKLGADQAHKVTLARPRVRVDLAWPSDLVEELPPDTVLRLKGTSAGAIEVKLADACREHDQVSLRFSWDDEASATTLEAAGAGKTVTLWKDQAFTDKDAPKWEGDLADLLAAPADPVAGEEKVDEGEELDEDEDEDEEDE